MNSRPKCVSAPWVVGVLLIAVAGIVATRFCGPAAPSPFREAQAGILRATLSNGLRVIIVQNSLAPVVATSVNYIVGSDEAPDGFPGMAHAQEHMMFRGSPNLTADQLANIGSIMGGNFNANTREHLTQYLFTVPAEDLDVALHIEAARMRDVLDTEEDWNQERGAIEQEVAQDLSNPDYVSYQRIRAALFAGTRYEHDALGTRPSFDKTTATMLKDFHDKWYAPNNAILILVGDLDPEATLGKVNTLFGPIASKTLPARPVFSPQPVVPETIVMDTDHPEGELILAMRVPGLDSPDFPALEVLADVISSERADLYALVPQGKALRTDFSIEPLPRAGLAYAQATFPEGSDPKVLESELRAVLGKIVKNGVPGELVAAAKLQERRQAEFQKNSIEGLASVWANAVAVYGLNSPSDDLERIEKVSVDDVNRAARTYLDLDDAISAVMRPRRSGRPIAASAGFGGKETILLGEAKPTPLPDWAESAVSRLTVPPSNVHPVVSILPNGLTLVVQREDVSDTVSIHGHIRNRPETEAAPGKEGVSQVLDELFAYGSETLDRLAFQQALDEIGASERAGMDFMIQALVSDFDRAAELLADNELHPALPASAMDVFKNQLVRVVAARNRSPDYLTQRAVREALFPEGDPSLRDATPETVSSLTIADVRTYYHTVARPDLATIVVIGKVSPELARMTIDKYFGGWSAVGPKPATDLPAAPPNRPSVVEVPDAARVQDKVMLAQNIALTRSDPDYYALQLGNAVLGGAFYSTRLSIDLRKNAGLVYSVGSSLSSGKTRSAYFVQYACDPQNVAKASAMVVGELKSMQAAPAGNEELGRVKAMLLRQIPLEESSIARIAGGLTQRWDLELPLDEPTRAAERYVALGPGDVQAAFQKWIRPDDLVRISQGPAPR